MNQIHSPLRVLVVGLGNMGLSHALAYEKIDGFEICGLVNRSTPDLPASLAPYSVTNDYLQTLHQLRPDVVSINTYTDTHAEYAIAAMNAGAHVFLEKPIATTVQDARRVIDTARKTNRKLLIGYILRHHPSWTTLIQQARRLGGPYVFRLNLNQQSSGAEWQTHRSLLETLSPIVDCGVHYVDVMCQVTDAVPVRVNGMGLRLASDIASNMYNYGQFQVEFEDGSIGWYEAGWGPMMSETAFFVKDIISPGGAVSIIMDEGAKSADMDTHTRTAQIRVHRSELKPDGQFAHSDMNLRMDDEPRHQELCDREQLYLLRAIKEDIDLERHMSDAVRSLAICLAADESIRNKKPVFLDQM